jgi:uncharacterized protein (DUF1778 family)
VGRLLVPLRRAWPRTKIIVRADSGFCRPRVLQRLERWGVSYIIGLQKNARLTQQLELASTSLSDFVRRSALEAAETDLLDRRIVTIPAKDWARFEAWASSPAREVPALRKLSKTRPVWQK